MKSEMDALKVQILPEHQSSSSSTYMLTKPKSKPTKSLILLIVAFVAVTLGLLYVFISRSSLRYSVVIDAGSSGTRVHVFGYWFESGEPVFDFGEKHYANLKLTPGLSAYADNPEGASESVTKLVEFAKKRIPKRTLKKSDIRLMATAGMRLLEVPVQEQILEVTRRVLRSSGFMFRDEWATVITGSDEGVYAWVIANHALGSLGSDPLETTGIVELGGASAQVTFVSSDHVPPEFSRTIAYGNVSYTIYSHSFLHYGKDAALKKLLESLQNSAANSTGDGIVEDPCTPKGYIYDSNSHTYSSGFLADESKLKGSLQAAGNFTKCRSATFALLQEGKENCLYEHCSIGSTFTPDLRGSFLATSNFYYTAKFFELEEKGWLSELIPAGKKYCGEEWSKLISEYPTTEEEYLRGYCFSSAYIISMLHDSLGIALDDERITYASDAGEKHIPLDWALGAFILDTVTPTSGYNASYTPWWVCIFPCVGLSLLVCGTVLLSVLFVGLFSIIFLSYRDNQIKIERKTQKRGKKKLRNPHAWEWLPITHLVRLEVIRWKQRPTGIVELGGASAQVTFVSSENVPPEFSRTISYGNVSYTIYSHSFLDFGLDAAEDKLLESLQKSGDGIITDPCHPKGYIYDTNSQKDTSEFLAEESKLKASLQVQAAGDFSKCRSATFAILQEGKECQYKHCSIGSTFTRKLQGSFLAKENFYYTSKFFGLEEKDWLSEMIPAGKRFCGEEWSKLKEKYPTEEKYLHRYCFSSAYIISMLHDSLGIALDDERIKYANKAGEENISLDWALGAFILNTATPTSDYSGKSRKMLGF